jgi:hypothetical protein
VTRFGRGLALAALAGGLLVAGCGSTSSAATVGGRTISIADVQRQYEAISTVETSPVPQAQLLNNAITVELVAELATREGVEVSDAEVDTALREQDLADTGSQVYDDLVREQMRARLQIVALTQQGLDVPAAAEQLAADVGVEVNPRYGTWTGITIEPGTGSISVPAEPAPAPSGS